jgi:hypothetical protein
MRFISIVVANVLLAWALRRLANVPENKNYSETSLLSVKEASAVPVPPPGCGRNGGMVTSHNGSNPGQAVTSEICPEMVVILLHKRLCGFILYFAP